MLNFSTKLINNININVKTIGQIRNATKLTGGSTKNGRDSIGRRLGLKKAGGEPVIPGNIIIRQRGTKYRAGENVGVGRDHTIFALTDGWVKFHREKIRNKLRTIVNVVGYNPNPNSKPEHRQVIESSASK